VLAELVPGGAHLWHTTDLDPLHQLHRDNVVLLGDSAHPMLPFTSQGSSSALEDALRLAAKFLYENEAMIREKVKAESPWWVPGAVDSRVGDKIVSGVEKTLVAVAAASC
jgi:flavin-dependent dehydrogenase